MFTLGISSVSAAPGDTIYINGSNGNDANDGYSWTTAKLSIRNGVNTVNENGTVNIADGQYTGTGNTNLLISKSMTINGQSRDGTIIDGGNTAHIFEIATDKNVIIQNLKMVNGTSFSSNGGAIYNTYANLTIIDCSFTNNNVTTSDGGAIYNIGNLTIFFSDFTNNDATTNRGGAIYNTGNLNVVASVFAGNNANNGGAIFNLNGNSTVIASAFGENHATRYGGAIYNSNTMHGSNMTIHFNRIVDNIADEGGNAILNSETAITDAQFNWWGTNNPDFTSLISGTVDHTPWLYLTFSPSPTTIPQGSTSTLTASFNNAFDGTTVTAFNPSIGYIPDGTPVTFTTTLGNVGSKSVVKYTVQGIATAVLRADETAGTALVAVYSDYQTPLNSTVIITPVANAVNSVSSTGSRIIGMQETGIPIAGLILSILMLLGGIITSKK